MGKEKSLKEKQDYLVHETKDWIYALKLAAIIFIIIVYYHYMRRGIFLPQDFIGTNVSFLDMANKGFAITAVFMITISILIAPIAQFISSWGKKIGYRKEIGIIGVYLAIIHLIISFLFLPWKYDVAWYQDHQLSIILAILSIIILIIITITSTKYHLVTFGYKKWKGIQRLVYPALILAVLHIMVLGKIAGWKKWFVDPSVTYYLPPGTLVTISFVALALILRLIVIFKKR